MEQSKTLIAVYFGLGISILLLVGLTGLGPIDSDFVSLEQAIAPYLDVIGRNPDEVYPGMTTVLTWGMYKPIVLIVRKVDATGWRVVAFYQSSSASVPSPWQMVIAMAQRQMAESDYPTDPWGNPLPWEAVHPEERL